MNLKNLTNVELLYHENLANKLMIKIPGTNFHILCTYVQRNDSWNAHLIELMTTKRRQVAKNVTTTALETFVSRIIGGRQKITFKNARMKDLSKEIKRMIKIAKNKHQNEL